MLTKLIYLRAALYDDALEAARITFKLDERPEAHEGYVHFVTDTAAMPVFGSARITWLAPPDAVPRPFVTAYMGHEPLMFVVCGATSSVESFEQARDLTRRLLDQLRAEMNGIAPALENDHDVLIYAECDDWQGHERHTDAVPQVWSTVVNSLKLANRGYDWKSPAALANVIGIPGGTLELKFEDIIVGFPHEDSDKLLRIPDVIRDLITLKLLLHSWAPQMTGRIHATRTNRDLPSILATRRDWLFRSAKARAELRAVESSAHVEGYIAGAKLIPIPLPQAKLNMHFLQHLAQRLTEAFRDLREQLAFEEELSTGELVQYRHEYDFRLAEENISLQRTVKRLTWVMLLMTAILLIDSPTLRTAISSAVDFAVDRIVNARSSPPPR